RQPRGGIPQSAARGHARPVRGAVRRQRLPGRRGHRRHRRRARAPPARGRGMIDDRVLAMAGLVQALKQVRRIADTGQADASVLATSLESVFRIDAASPEEVYGGARNLRPGLLLLRDYLTNEGDDAVAGRVHEGIVAIRSDAERLGSTHPEVLSALGGLYADTVSQLRPKVMVQGNPHYLGQAGVVAEIRAILLSALRSAVLWRQL